MSYEEIDRIQLPEKMKRHRHMPEWLSEFMRTMTERSLTNAPADTNGLYWATEAELYQIWDYATALWSCLARLANEEIEMLLRDKSKRELSEEYEDENDKAWKTVDMAFVSIYQTIARGHDPMPRHWEWPLVNELNRLFDAAGGGLYEKPFREAIDCLISRLAPKEESTECE